MQMDRPLKDGQLMLDDGQVDYTSPAATATVQGHHPHGEGWRLPCGSRRHGQPVRLSEDYFIATDKANPPQIAIERPAATIAPARSKRSQSA